MRATMIWIGLAMLAIMLALSAGAAGAAGGGKGGTKGGAKEHLRIFIPAEISDDFVTASRAALRDCRAELGGGKGGKGANRVTPAVRKCLLAKLDGVPQFDTIADQCSEHNDTERAAAACIRRSLKQIFKLKGVR
jgi:hypothetical protein